MGQYLTFNQVRARITPPDNATFQDLIITNGEMQIEAQVSPVSPLGNSGQRLQVASGPRTASLSFEYFPTGTVADAVAMATGISYSGSVISFCGYTAYEAYLNSFSMEIAPYQPIKVSANYDIYGAISGSLSTGGSNIASTQEVAHAINTQYTNFNEVNFLMQDLKSISYSVSIERQPQYILGRETPGISGVIMTSVTKEVSVEGNNLGAAIDYTGKALGSVASIQLRSAKSNTNILPLLTISGIVVSQSISAEEAGIVNGRVTVREIAF